jgi:hypothetical protein
VSQKTELSAQKEELIKWNNELQERVEAKTKTVVVISSSLGVKYYPYHPFSNNPMTLPSG